MNDINNRESRDAKAPKGNCRKEIKWGKFEFRPSPWIIYKSLLTTTVIVLCLLTCILFSVPRLYTQFRESGQPGIINTFRTVTVEASISAPAFRDEFHLDENSLSLLIIKELSKQIENKFGGGISSSPYGKPITFGTNPLNLGLSFEVVKDPYTRKEFCLRVSFKRAQAYSLLTAQEYDPEAKNKFDELIRTGNSALSKPELVEELPLGPRYAMKDVFSNEDQLTEVIGFLSQIIVQNMTPKYWKASYIEARISQERP